MSANPFATIDPKIIEDMLAAFAEAGAKARPESGADLAEIQAANLAAFTAATATMGEAFRRTAEEQVAQLQAALDTIDENTSNDAATRFEEMAATATTAGAEFQAAVADSLRAGRNQEHPDE